MLDKKEWNEKFREANERAFTVPFPDGKTKVVIRPLPPRRYKALIAVVKDVLGMLEREGLPRFTLKDDTILVGESLGTKGSNVRIQVANEDIREIPQADVKRIDIPTALDVMKKADTLLWENAPKMLAILFPEQRDLFNQEYIDEYLHVPFMKTLLSLMAELNGLEGVIPFLKERLVSALKAQSQAT